MRRLSIFVFLFLAILIGLRIAIGYWVNTQLTKHLNARESRWYDITYSNMDVRLLEGSVWLEDFKLSPRTEVFDSLVQLRKNPAIALSFQVDQLVLQELNYKALLKDGLSADKIEVDNPSVKLYLLPKPLINDSASGGTKQTEFSYSHIDLKYFGIQNARAEVFKVSYSDTLDYGSMEAFNFSVEGIDYNADSILTPLMVEDAYVNLGGVRLNDLNGYKVELDSARLNFKDNILNLKGGSLSPLVSIEQFEKQGSYRKALFSYTFEKVLLEDVAYEQALYQEWIAKHLALEGFNMDLFINNNLPFHPEKDFSFPVSKLMRIPKTLAIDSVSLSNCSFIYRIPGKELESRAKLFFEDINGNITGFTNQRNGDENQVMEANLSCVPHATGRIESNWKFDLAEDADDFRVQVELTGADLTKFNSIIESTTHVHVKNGAMPSLSFQIVGDAKSAYGSIAYQLENMDIQLNKVKEEGKKEQKFLSFVANKVVHSKHDEPRNFKGTYKLNRPEQTSFFKFIWLGLQEGLKEGFIHNTYKKELRKEKKA